MGGILVNVRVQNNFSTLATKIQLWHQFGSNTVQNFTWSNVAPNGNSTSYVEVFGSTADGHDYWQIMVTLKGDTVWEHTSWKTCTIESSDMNTYQTQNVSAGYWSIPLNSGGCTTTLQEVGSVAEDVKREPESKKAAGTTKGDAPPAK